VLVSCGLVAARVLAAHYELMNPESQPSSQSMPSSHHASLLNNDFYEGDMLPSKYLEDVPTLSLAEGFRMAPESIIDRLCLSMACRPVWTCATINVVVLEMQAVFAMNGRNQERLHMRNGLRRTRILSRMLTTGQ
jgi:hypothetical protein